MIKHGQNKQPKIISIPHRSIIDSLKDKCKLFLNIVETEESYTSKSSFVDQDELPIFDKTTISKHNSQATESNTDCTNQKLAY